MKTKTRPLTKPLKSLATSSRDIYELAQQIRQQILSDVEDPRLRELGAHIIKRYHVPSREPRALARAFQLFSQHSVKFFREFPEINAAPWITAKWGIGDCDDKARLIAALLKQFRIPVRLTYVSFHDGRRAIAHVWPEVKLKKQWAALESVREWPLGKSALEAIKRKGYPYKTFYVEI